MYIITDYRAFDCLGMTYFLSIYEGNDAAASSFLSAAVLTRPDFTTNGN